MAEVKVLESATPHVNEEQAIGVYSGRGGITNSFCGCGCNAVDGDGLVMGNVVDRDALVVGNAVDRGALVVVLFARASIVAMCCIAPSSTVARFGTEGQEDWGGRAGVGGPLFVQPPLRPGKQVVH